MMFQMSIELSLEQQTEYLAVARKAAAQVSRDNEVISEAADVAVTQLAANWDHVSDAEGQRRRWVGVVAQNHARRLGKKLGRDRQLINAGNQRRADADPKMFEMVGLLITEMRHGDGRRFSSLAADRADFDRAWVLISGEDRALLHAKYVEGLSSKQIAEERGVAPGTINNKLTAAKKAAALLFDDLIGSFDRDEDRELL